MNIQREVIITIDSQGRDVSSLQVVCDYNDSDTPVRIVNDHNEELVYLDLIDCQFLTDALSKVIKLLEESE